ncbi:hypothetical protein OAL35_00060 [bacterium]|nr:hypothetical protein [bacterium]
MVVQDESFHLTCSEAVNWEQLDTTLALIAEGSIYPSDVESQMKRRIPQRLYLAEESQAFSELWWVSSRWVNVAA